MQCHNNSDYYNIDRFTNRPINCAPVSCLSYSGKSARGGSYYTKSERLGINNSGGGGGFTTPFITGLSAITPGRSVTNFTRPVPCSVTDHTRPVPCSVTDIYYAAGVSRAQCRVLLLTIRGRCKRISLHLLYIARGCNYTGGCRSIVRAHAPSFMHINTRYIEC